MWRDGTGWNVGRNDSPDDPRYGFLRDADYVSGAALLIRRELFERAGGFSETFAPAYYEDVDLCFTFARWVIASSISRAPSSFTTTALRRETSDPA